MSEKPDDEDLTAEPHGDAGEPPRLVGVVGGLVTEPTNVIVSVLMNQFPKDRVACLVMAVDVLMADQSADQFKAAELAMHYERYLRDGVNTEARKPELKSVTGGKSSAS